MRRPQPIVLLVVLVVTLGVLAQVVPFYTDWLWFGEVGYQNVFWSILSLRGGLFTAVTVAVLVFLWANLTFAARTAAPDVIWELEDQLGLPGARRDRAPHPALHARSCSPSSRSCRGCAPACTGRSCSATRTRSRSA